jgi:lipopolysaccharide transport protein LptA
VQRRKSREYNHGYLLMTASSPRSKEKSCPTAITLHFVLFLAISSLSSTGIANAQSATPSPAALDNAQSPAATDKTSQGSPFAGFENSNRGPVHIQSNSLSLDYKNNTVVFQGHVHATQADGELTSNTLNVKYGKDFHEIQDMIADGDVRMSQGLRWCTSDHGVLNQALHTVVLTGNPVCHDANDQISGTKITVHLDTGKSEVEGGVKAVIFPREGKTRDNGVSAKTETPPNP